MALRPGLGSGPGRVLIAVYGVFALSATGRAVYQLATAYSDAPVPYLLSLLSAVVYVLATVALARDLPRLAWPAIGVELVGVLVVGTVSLADSADFPDDTVWSSYGSGYGFVPLVLPVLGLLWLRAQARAADQRS